MDVRAADDGERRDSLPLRLATAVVGIPVLASAVWIGGIPLVAVTVVAAFFAGRELFALLHRRGMAIRLAAAICVQALLLSGLVLRSIDDGLAWLSYAILITFASDTAAYTVGRLFGRHQLAPAISPGKTWEGAAGGVIGAAGASVIFAVILQLDALPIAAAIPLAVILSMLGQLGDLGESWLKRRAGVKDSGRLLPGHGGILDRLDSLLLILPAVLAYAVLRTTMG